MMKAWWIKWTQWEFWPTWLVYLPVLLCYPLWALRARSLYFYSLINPGLTMGGLYGTAKSEALIHLGADDQPRSFICQASTPPAAVEAQMKKKGWTFPVVIKPEFGERGQGVDLVKDVPTLHYAVGTQRSAFLVQQYIDLPFEAGVFYIRHPKEATGRVVSVVEKGFLTITGDGVQTVEQLALQNKRALLIWDRLKRILDDPLDDIVPAGETRLLEPIGNHSRGTAFNNGNHHITDALQAWAERIARRIPGFYYGRFDVRAPSVESFQRGEGIQVMEVNGANAEPAHIYQEGASLWKGWATLLKFWSMAASIAAYNRRQHPPTDFQTAHQAYTQWRSIKTDKWDRKPTNGAGQ